MVEQVGSRSCLAIQPLMIICGGKTSPKDVLDYIVIQRNYHHGEAARFVCSLSFTNSQLKSIVL